MERQPFTSATVDGEMSLSELLAMFKAHWLLVSGSLAFALACAGIYLVQAPSQYEAAVTIKLGYFGYADMRKFPSWNLEKVLIENETGALNRMRGAEFQSSVISSLGWSEEKQVEVFKASYQVSNPADGHLRVTVRGMSPENAARAATSSADMIISVHRELLEATAARKNRELVKVESDIADLETFLRSLDGPARKQSQPDSKLQASNWLRIINNEKSQLRDLQNQRLMLREMASAEFNSPTQTIGPISVSDQAVHPKARRVWFFSALVGVLLGVFLVTVVEIRRMNLGAASSSADGDVGIGSCR